MSICVLGIKRRKKFNFYRLSSSKLYFLYVVYYTSIKLMNLKVVLNVSTRLYNHHYYAILEHFIILRRNLLVSEHYSFIWVNNILL